MLTALNLPVLYDIRGQQSMKAPEYRKFLVQMTIQRRLIPFSFKTKERYSNLPQDSSTTEKWTTGFICRLYSLGVFPVMR